MDDDITNYPLSWPVGRDRTPLNSRKRSAFGRHSVIQSAKDLENQMKIMRATGLVISTNVKVRNDGLPYSSQRPPDDTGVAVYFDWKKKPIVFACDKWRTVEENLWAIAKHIEALRGQERWGVGSLDQAFAGYAALPDPNERKPWEVLGISPTATSEDARLAYKALCRKYHPDTGENGGDVEQFDRVQKAYKLFIGEGG